MQGDRCSGGYVLKAPVRSNATYQWYRDSIALAGATGSLYRVPDTLSHPSHYNVKITTALSCVVSETFTVQLSLLQGLKPPPSDTVICAGDTARLLPAVPGIRYTWNGRTDTVISVYQPGAYTITVSDTAGYRRVFTTTVRLQGCLQCKAYVPTAFTPNQDGKNDVFCVQFGCMAQDYHLQIYNRWGRRFFDSKDQRRGWDGTYQGEKLPQGVYVYLLRYSAGTGESKTEKGTLALIE